MDPSERCAANFLAQRGYKNVVYEPDGNVPPDFLVDGYLAVEIRRLNQNFDFGTRIEGLEQASIPLWKKYKLSPRRLVHRNIVLVGLFFIASLVLSNHGSC
jgi:hypothetical protein